MQGQENLRLGIDLGGTKIAGVVLDGRGQVVADKRVPTPAGDYQAIISEISQVVRHLEIATGNAQLPVGIGSPGAVSPATGLIKNANSVCLNGQSLRADLEVALDRSVRVANDADCLAVSEATDGAGMDANVVFGVILGTGVGDGLVLNKQLLSGANAIAGEWGHNPLPWPDPVQEQPGPPCWCGRHGCHETWLSGPGLAADFLTRGGERLDAETIARLAAAGSKAADDTLVAYEHRLARGLASVINLLDPSVIVLGGGLSGIQRLYRNVPRYWQDYVFSDRVETALRPAQHGDASGVRGAAWLW